jgi:phosphatidylinositol alpha-1,6-mannosyltransferase
MLRALPMIVRAIPNVRHIIVGDGDDRTRLEHVARDCGVAGIVEFRGRVSMKDLAKAYTECSLFVLPSMGEGFGIVFLEAASFGKAVLGGAAGGAPEVILEGFTGRLVDGTDVDAIAATIVAMLADSAALDTMGEQARRRVAQEFSWSAFAPRARSVLDGLTQASSVDRQRSLQTFL